MIQSPGLRITVRRGDAFAVDGVHAQRARRFAELVLQNVCRQRACEYKSADLQRHLHIKVECAPREHIGLGVGTQLGLAIAAAICEAFERQRPGAIDLAHFAGRGARSGIGTHGFDYGGFLVDGGKSRHDSISQLIAHVEIAAQWRFVLLCPKSAVGFSGEAEQTAFEQLPPTPLAVTNQLRRLALDELAPAAGAGDLVRFSRALYRFNHTAGTCFAPAQGGVFSSEQTTRLVARLRRMGIDGVGQSSWGPTVFALCESQAAAEDLLRQVRPSAEAEDYECLISAPANQGAVIEVLRDQ